MKESELPKPWKYKNNWIIWPETILDILTISDCNDTVNGICLSGKSIKECIDECKDSCGAGYHIEFENGSTLCAPLRTTVNPLLNQIHRLKKKDVYPELKYATISTFINTDHFPFPPEEANVVFFRDVVDIIDVVNKMSITTNIRENDYIYLKKENKNNLQFRETTQTLGQISQYIPLQYGVPVQISIPGTSLLISNSDKNILTWNASPIVFSTENTTFILRSLDPKKNKDKISYGDIFYITYGAENYIVVINTQLSRLEIVKDSLEQIDINKQFLYKFTLESNMMGYYCDGRECKKIPIKDMEKNGHIGRYKNVTVGRDPNCWGVCKYLELGTNSYSLLSDKPPVNKRSKHFIFYKILFMFSLLSMIVFILSIIIKRFFF
jgi:hypothetical protein